MNLKTFRAQTMAQALAAVKRDLGTDAVILHTRSYKQGGILGIGARQVVEVTAGDGRQLGRARQRAATRNASANTPRSTGGAGPGPSSEPTAGDLIRRTYAAARAELVRKDAAQAAPAAPGRAGVSPLAAAAHTDTSRTSATTAGGDTAVLSRPAAGAAVLADASQSDSTAGTSHATAPWAAPTHELAEEMRFVRDMVGKMLRRQQRDTARTQIPESLFDSYMSLLKQEITEELAEQVMQEVSEALDEQALSDEQKVRDAMRQSLAKLMPIDAGAGRLEPTGDGRPRTIALIGPTGVGKTTTIAKLAATFKLKYGKNVGLITIDTYRIAAVEQLRTYANIIKLPLHVVMSPEEMTRALKKCAGCDVVLIDTAGRSQRDDPKLDQLAQFIEVADPHEVHLVLASTCTQPVLLETIKKFSRIRTDRIIFTKLDEAVTFGVLLNVTRQVRKRLSFVTTGQEVPHEIEPGQSERLAGLLMGEATL